MPGGGCVLPGVERQKPGRVWKRMSRCAPLPPNVIARARQELRLQRQRRGKPVHQAPNLFRRNHRPRVDIRRRGAEDRDRGDSHQRGVTPPLLRQVADTRVLASSRSPSHPRRRGSSRPFRFARSPSEGRTHPRGQRTGAGTGRSWPQLASRIDVAFEFLPVRLGEQRRLPRFSRFVPARLVKAKERSQALILHP